MIFIIHNLRYTSILNLFLYHKIFEILFLSFFLFQIFQHQGLLLNKIFNFHFKERFSCRYCRSWILKGLKNILYLLVHFIYRVFIRIFNFFWCNYILPSHNINLIFIKFVVSHYAWLISWMNHIFFIILYCVSLFKKLPCVKFTFLETLQWILYTLHIVIWSEDNRIFSKLYFIILFCLFPVLNKTS